MQRDPEDKKGQAFTNPTAIFEMLSKTTEAFDRGSKWGNYRQIESLKYYVLVAPKEPRVEASSGSLMDHGNTANSMDCSQF